MCINGFMKIGDAEYLAENLDVVRRNYKNRRFRKRHPQFEIVLPFISGCRKILSVGGGAVEPTVIKATHLIDIAPNAGELAGFMKWKGYFRCCSCTNIPAPAKYFDVAVCREVIEHLPTLEDVKKTLYELERVAKKWIVTTPAYPLGPRNPEKTHKRFLDLETLKRLSPKYKVEVLKIGDYNYVKRS